MRQHMLHQLHRRRLHGRKIRRGRSSHSQSCDTLKSVEHPCVNEFIFSSPFEHPLDAADLLVHMPSTPSHSYHFFPHHLQAARSEVADARASEEFTKWSQCVFDALG